MTPDAPVIEIAKLVRRYGRTDAVDGLDLRLEPGRCYGFFGRNGAGKTTTIKCLLNLLRPTAGAVRVFGLDPAKHEVAVKSHLAYVPDYVAFYPWMTVRQTLDYFASFRSRWNQDTERTLLERFRLDERQKAAHLSKGQRTQLALATAVCRRGHAFQNPVTSAMRPSASSTNRFVPRPRSCPSAASATQSARACH